MTREPHGEDHDLFVSLHRVKEGPPRYAYAIAKTTYAIGDDSLERVAPRTLQKDPYHPECQPRIPQGSDYWWQKRRTDVVVEGSAWARGGTAVERSEVVARIGDHTKRVAVFGRRFIEYTSGGRAYIGPPEPFESIPLDDAHAYGGMDPRVPIRKPHDLHSTLAIVADHPGMYPRNPMGCGYLVLTERVDGFELPNLEDPDDLLTDERLFAKELENWHRQPLPWTLGWQHAMSFTRLASLGADARFPASDATELEEVKRGFLPADYLARARSDEVFQDAFYQEASLGMTFDPLPEGTPITVSGVHPSRLNLSFELPKPPRIEITIEGAAEQVPPLLTGVVVEPDELRVSFIYCGRTKGLPRVFIPGIHPTIPLSARLDEGDPLHYTPPPTIDLPPFHR